MPRHGFSSPLLWVLLSCIAHHATAETCDPGYVWDGVACEDVNECAANTHNCAAGGAGVCTNTVGAFTCACAPGYSGNGVTCADVDECAAGTHVCARTASCSNTAGSYTCACLDGFSSFDSPDGLACVDQPRCLPTVTLSGSMLYERMTGAVGPSVVYGNSEADNVAGNGGMSYGNAVWASSFTDVDGQNTDVYATSVRFPPATRNEIVFAAGSSTGGLYLGTRTGNVLRVRAGDSSIAFVDVAASADAIACEGSVLPYVDGHVHYMQWWVKPSAPARIGVSINGHVVCDVTIATNLLFLGGADTYAAGTGAGSLGMASNNAAFGESTEPFSGTLSMLRVWSDIATPLSVPVLASQFAAQTTGPLGAPVANALQVRDGIPLEANDVLLVSRGTPQVDFWFRTPQNAATSTILASVTWHVEIGMYLFSSRQVRIRLEANGDVVIDSALEAATPIVLGTLPMLGYGNGAWHRYTLQFESSVSTHLVRFSFDSVLQGTYSVAAQVPALPFVVPYDVYQFTAQPTVVFNAAGSLGTPDAILWNAQVSSGRACGSDDSCAAGTHSCEANARCTAAYDQQQADCWCEIGYVGNGTACENNCPACTEATCPDSSWVDRRPVAPSVALDAAALFALPYCWTLLINADTTSDGLGDFRAGIYQIPGVSGATVDHRFSSTILFPRAISNQVIWRWGAATLDTLSTGHIRLSVTSHVSCVASLPHAADRVYRITWFIKSTAPARVGIYIDNFLGCERVMAPGQGISWSGVTAFTDAGQSIFWGAADAAGSHAFGGRVGDICIINTLPSAPFLPVNSPSALSTTAPDGSSAVTAVVLAGINAWASRSIAFWTDGSPTVDLWARMSSIPTMNAHLFSVQWHRAPVGSHAFTNFDISVYIRGASTRLRLMQHRNQRVFQHSLTTGQTLFTTSDLPFANNQWHRYTLQFFAGTKVAFWFDGKLQTTQTMAFAVTAPMQATVRLNALASSTSTTASTNMVVWNATFSTDFSSCGRGTFSENTCGVDPALCSSNQCSFGITWCSALATCAGTSTTFTCTCNAGYSGNGVTCTDVDECALNTDNCDALAACSNTVGSFSCACNSGFTGDGSTCTDVNECTAGTHNCGASATCNNVPGGFTCVCNALGFVWDGSACVDVDECTTGTHNCAAAHAACWDSEGSFSCFCDNGFDGDGVTCTDIDECVTGTHFCDTPRATCANTVGGHTCACNAGYTGDGETCADANECVLGSDNCASVADCSNTAGSFTCACPAGYTGNGVVCADVDECAANTDNCDAVNGACSNTQGAFTCSCNSGYAGNGVTCADVNECTANTHNCDNTATCSNSAGTFECLCQQGYTWNGVTCVDADECLLGTHFCPANAVCNNVPGTFGCTCNPGFTGNGPACTDVDECVAGTHNCDAVNGACTNTPGAFTCACNAGFAGNGVTCSDVDECAADTDNCHALHATCTNTAGAFTCACNAGYTGNGVTCVFGDECFLNVDNCDAAATCADNEGSFSCTCNAGFSGSGVTCADVDECTANTDNCDAANGACTNVPGGFTCACNTGFTGNGVTCLDVDECAADTDNCHALHATCTNTPGAFTCACNAGFSGDGVTCADVDECAANTDNCDAVNGACSNTVGAFTCACNPGFSGDGVTCADVDECAMNTDNCDAVNGACSNTVGGFTCVCNTGFTGNGVTCTDVDECAMGTDDCSDATGACRNTAGSFQCSCLFGYAGNGTFCADVDECALDTDRCSAHATCSNTVGWRSCECAAGWTDAGTWLPESPGWVPIACTDPEIPERTLLPSDVNNPSGNDSYWEQSVWMQQRTLVGCPESCGGGYCVISALGFVTCESQASARWMRNATCYANLGQEQTSGRIDVGCYEPNEIKTWVLRAPTVWSFDTDGVAQANSPFGAQPAMLVLDVSRVALGSGDRLSVHVCRDELYDVAYGEYYALHGGDPLPEQVAQYCSEREWSTGVSYVEGVSLPSVTHGSPTGFRVVACTGVAMVNFISDSAQGSAGFSVEWRMVPQSEIGIWSAGAACPSYPFYTDVPNSVPASAYTRNQVILSSMTNGNNNPVGAYVDDWYGLAFPDMYPRVLAADAALACAVSGEGGMFCADANECTLDTDTCHATLGTCSNSAGSFSCACVSGYAGNGVTCTDVDECALSTDNCDAVNAVCTNSEGSFTCACVAGFAGTGVACTDIDECVAGTHSCAAAGTAACSNIAGSYTCACVAGFDGDGFLCSDVDECAINTDTCHATLATCSNAIGSFACACVTGYSGDGTACADVDECAFGFDDCDAAHASCSNTAGSFTCSCNAGFSGNGVFCADVDECVTGSDDCHAANARCTNILGSYTCGCFTGFTGDGRTACTDNNECALETDNCDANADCVNEPGSFSCSCGAGYTGDGVTCAVGNECLVGTDNCTALAICADLDPGFSCTCPLGYSGDGAVACTDIDECLANSDDCLTDGTAVCANTAGSFTCACVSGYVGDGVTVCLDVNECFQDNGMCPTHSTCENHPGWHACPCNPGYELAPSGPPACVDVDECEASSHNCNVTGGAACVNDPGTFSCVCRPGYAGDGGVCSDVDECSAGGTHNCAAQTAVCTNTQGSFACACAVGYVGDGVLGCADIDECALGTHACATPSTVCANTNGSYQCVANPALPPSECLASSGALCACAQDGRCMCVPGYVGDGTGSACVDIDECADPARFCNSSFATCTNTPGTFACSCNAGSIPSGQYTGYVPVAGVPIREWEYVPLVCLDVDECTTGTTFFGYDENDEEIIEQGVDNCAPGTATCSNTAGSFACSCVTGYTGDGVTCTDVNECATGAHGCGAQAACINTPGTFQCSCLAGYTGDGVTCTDVNECVTGAHDCGPLAACANLPGSFSCSCNAGFAGDGFTCLDVNECSSGAHNCAMGGSAACSNSDGSFSCACVAGFSGNGLVCTDIDECAAGTDNCHANAACANEAGSFTCACNAGYFGDGVASCADVDECALDLDNCPAYRSCVNAPGSFTCVCPPGTYDNTLACAVCDVGFYCTNSARVECPVGSTAGPGSTSIAACVPDLPPPVISPADSAMHTMLLFTDCGNIYRQVDHTAACNCMRNGRVASERCEYPAGSVRVTDGLAARLELPGHGEVAVGPLPQGVREVRAVEIWRTSVLDGLSSARGVVVENVCGKLPAQDVSGLVASGFAREINKCFGRRYCMYSLYGNVSFDRGSEWLQYRGVRCVERFRTFAARRGIDCTGMTVHLVILSGHIGQLVTVSMHGTLRQRLLQTGRYTHHSRIEDDSTNVNLAAALSASELQLFKSVHVVVTRRGCVMIRVAIGGKSVELTDDVMATTRARAEDIMRDVVQQC